MSKWIWTTVTDDIIRSNVHDGLYRITGCSVPMKPTWKSSEILTYAIVVWGTNTDEMALISAIHVNFLVEKVRLSLRDELGGLTWKMVCAEAEQATRARAAADALNFMF